MTATSIHDELAQAHHPRGAVDRAPGAVATAFAELADRRSRLGHTLDELGSILGTLEATLAPVLSQEPYAEASDRRDPSPEPVDTRGAVAQQISSEAQNADRMADVVTAYSRQLGRILDRLEV